MARRAPDQLFQEEWNKAVAWAQTLGIPANDYIPIYQLDATRIANAQPSMSAAERNRAILAANNPNNVTPNPVDNPQPTSVFANARQDLGEIATGLEPWHLAANLFDTVLNTAKDVIDPKRLIGKSFDATAANILQDTLLSFVPGAYDAGAYLRAGGGMSGVDALAQHPLISLLDALPAGSSKLLSSAIADTEAGAKIASQAGMSSIRDASVGKILTNLLMNNKQVKPRVGVKPGDASAGLTQLTVGDRLQTWLGNTPFATSRPIQEFVAEYMLNNQLHTQIYQNLLRPALDAYSNLTDDEKLQLQQVFDRNRFGDDMERLLHDPTISLKVRDVAAKFINGPLRYETEMAVALRDVTPIRRPDGSVGLYSSRQHDGVRNAKSRLSESAGRFIASLDAADRLRTNIESLDKSVPGLVQTIDQANQAARKAIPRDETLLDNIREDYTPPGANKPDVLVFGKKRDQADKMFGNGGMVESLLSAVKEQDLDAINAMAPIVRQRLSEWGASSVDANANPAFKGVRDGVVLLEHYAKERTKRQDEVFKRIEQEPARVTAEVKRQKEDVAVLHKRQTEHMNDQQALDRQRLREGKAGAINKAHTDLDTRVRELTILSHQEDVEDIARGDNATLRATKAQADIAYREVRARIRRRARVLTTAIRHEQEKNQEVIARLNAQWGKNEGLLKARHDAERQELKVKQGKEKTGVGGELKRNMRAYVRALQDFQRAVYDFPTDEYRDIRYQAYTQRLIDGAHNAELVDATEKRLVQSSGWGQSALDQLRQDPARLREVVAETVEDVFNNPANYDPQLTDAVKEARDEALTSAVDEINTLIAQGYRPQWLPAAGPYDLPRSSAHAIIGKGIPSLDVSKIRTNTGVNTRYDVVAGMTKAALQRVNRDATIDFVAHHIEPIAITGAELRDQLDRFGQALDFDPNVGTLRAARSTALGRLGLAQFDPKALFGFTLPRWESEAMYLPAGLVDALERLNSQHRAEDFGIFDKTNKLFRYSILGLSPRYTAHILFGGAFLLALRSTPYMPSMLVKAAKALREGTLPQEIFRTPTQEGYSRFDTALNQVHWAGGKQLAYLLAQEHISLVQKVERSNVSPLHWLKAAADINFRFTRSAVRMQSAMAYLDYAAKAERKGHFVDEVTGERREMTKERAMQEGMKHVEEVFGNLRSMSPFERAVARNVMPFYGWTRHILNYVLSFPSDHPWRALVLSLMAFENSQNVPKGLSERIQFLFFMGSPDAQGNVHAIDFRFMDPLRDVANYMTWGGFIEGLNPVLLAPFAMIDPQMVFGSSSLYPNLTFNQFYGIETSGSQSSPLTALEQIVPQLGAMGQAVDAATQYRSLASTNKNAFWKSVFEALNVPFAQDQTINVKQIAAHDEIARYQVAKAAATTAFDSGNFSGLSGYASVPNPLNPDYETTPAELQAVYNQTLAQYPGEAPSDVLVPPPTPPGY